MDGKRRYLELVSARYLLFPSTRDGTSISYMVLLRGHCNYYILIGRLKGKGLLINFSGFRSLTV